METILLELELIFLKRSINSGTVKVTITLFTSTSHVDRASWAIDKSNSAVHISRGLFQPQNIIPTTKNRHISFYYIISLPCDAVKVAQHAIINYIQYLVWNVNYIIYFSFLLLQFEISCIFKCENKKPFK